MPSTGSSPPTRRRISDAASAAARAPYGEPSITYGSRAERRDLGAGARGQGVALRMRQEGALEAVHRDLRELVEGEVERRAACTYFTVTPPLKNSSVPDGSIDRCGMPSIERLAPIHSGLTLGNAHALGDDRQFVGRHDRQLALVAHLGAARIPRLAAAGSARRAGVEIAVDAVEAENQLVDRARLEMVERRDVDAGHLGRQLAGRQDFRFSFGRLGRSSIFVPSRGRRRK